eukprot:TRINITY_DN15343_c0_g3_i1.p1 TRINITY_DN15343_c0_g3~~TRINITY_DN15343_c0_g3_i1.p1  ORF type:complete len:183 (-),score=1.12 TRINITY_DN15343_c0_g3_i1:215-715(-)
MMMTFHFSASTVLWFDSWVIDTPIKYFLSLLGLFVLCLFQEFVSSLRVLLSKQFQKKVGKSHYKVVSETQDASINIVDDLNLGLEVVNRIPRGSAIMLTLLYGLNLITSYLLMLAVMTYNCGYFIIIVGGLMTGHHLVTITSFQITKKPIFEKQLSDACCPLTASE